MTTLVTGATGLIGRALVDQLLAAGVAVRAISRAPQRAALPYGVQVVPGDITDPASLGPALAGVDRMYLFSADSATQAIASMAREAGVGRIVLLSGLGTAQPQAIEDAVAAAGLEWTHLRPGAFAANTLWQWSAQIRTTGAVCLPYPDAATAPIHEADIAAVAKIALLDEGHTSQRYELTGPESLTHRQQVAAIGRALHRDIRLIEESPQRARQRLLAEMPAPLVERLLQRWAEASHSPATVLPTLEEVIGTARSFACWAADHAHDFT